MATNTDISETVLSIYLKNNKMTTEQAFKFGVEHAKNNLTVDVLDVALRSAGVQIHINLLDRVIDVAKLIIDKGGDTTIKDIEELKLIWEKDRG